MCTCVCVLSTEEEPLAGCPTFWTKFSGSSGYRFSSLFTPRPSSAQTIPTRQFSNSATTGIGENSSLKTWVNFHPGYIPRQICIVFFINYFKMFVFHKRTQSSASTRGGKVVDKVMKILFRNSNIYWVKNFQINLWVNFTHCVWRRLITVQTNHKTNNSTAHPQDL